MLKIDGVPVRQHLSTLCQREVGVHIERCYPTLLRFIRFLAVLVFAWQGEKVYRAIQPGNDEADIRAMMEMVMPGTFSMVFEGCHCKAVAEPAGGSCKYLDRGIGHSIQNFMMRPNVVTDDPESLARFKAEEERKARCHIVTGKITFDFATQQFRIFSRQGIDNGHS